MSSTIVRQLWFTLLCCTPLLLAQKPDAVKRTRTIKLTERAGIARSQFPVEATVRFEKDALKDAGQIRLLRLDGANKTPVAVQVLGVTSHEARDSFAPAAQTFVQLAFLADVPAKGTAVYEVVLDAAKPQAAPGKSLQITGEALGKAVDVGPAVWELHKPSGQLLTVTPKLASNDRLVFLQHKERGELPFHWNPDIWATGKPWGHTSDWNSPVGFDPLKHKADAPPAAAEKMHPFYYREWPGPMLYRLTRWGKMPFVPQVDVSVTYTFYAGAPFLSVQSLMEFREDMSVHAVRNAELVFSRHQFDTAVWLDKEGRFQRVPCYDYSDKDKSFQNVAKLPADVACLGFANERKGYGLALIVLSMTNLNKLTGHAGDEQAHFYIRDYDEHGKGSPANFLYFVRPLVYREGYLPTPVSAGSIYAERSAVVVFKLNADPAKKYDELIHWQKLLANPLEVVID